MLTIYLYLRGMWLGVAPRTCVDGHVFKRDQIVRAHIVIFIMGSIVSIIGGGGGGVGGTYMTI
jgi:hypothetical protein